MPAHNQSSNFHHDFLSLQRPSDIVDRLQFLGANDKAIIIDSKEIAEITIRSGDHSIATHYIIRPTGCSEKRIAKEADVFQLLPPSDGSAVNIDLTTIGGHYGAGVKIIINGVTIQLPPISAQQLALERDTPLFDLPAEELPPRPSAWAPEWAIILNDHESSGFTEVRSDSLRNGTISMFSGIGTCADNEDLAAYIRKGENVGSFFLLDGNLKRGDMAISIVARHLIDSIANGSDIGRAISSATAQLEQTIKQDCPVIQRYVQNVWGNRSYLGTCALGAEINGDKLSGYIIGDSRMIVLRPLADGSMEEIACSVGDNLAEQLEEANKTSPGKYTQEEIRKMRHIITRNISFPSSDIRQEARLLGPYQLQKGDLVMYPSSRVHLARELRI